MFPLILLYLVQGLLSLPVGVQDSIMHIGATAMLGYSTLAVMKTIAISVFLPVVVVIVVAAVV